VCGNFVGGFFRQRQRVLSFKFSRRDDDVASQRVVFSWKNYVSPYLVKWVKIFRKNAFSSYGARGYGEFWGLQKVTKINTN